MGATVKEKEFAFGKLTVIKKGAKIENGSYLPKVIAQLVGHLTCKSEVLGSIPGLAIYFCFSFR